MQGSACGRPHAGLNMLQSGLHKQHMKDLFVELCLTVPVRLSSLLPYLPMLMDPLVSALNGSQTLVSQGLRTLELCVDNLQPDFLYDHIQPVRAELMQVSARPRRQRAPRAPPPSRGARPIVSEGFQRRAGLPMEPSPGCGRLLVYKVVWRNTMSVEWILVLQHRSPFGGLPQRRVLLRLMAWEGRCYMATAVSRETRALSEGS